MYEIRANENGKEWVTCEEIGVGKQSFPTLEAAQAEVEYFIFSLASSYLDGYLLEFDEKKERNQLGILDLKTSEIYQTYMPVERD